MSQTREEAGALQMLARQFDALNERQFDALCNVAFGGYGAGCNPKTLQALWDRGLVTKVVRRDRQGNLSYAFTTWDMPISVHVAFCEWCASGPMETPQ